MNMKIMNIGLILVISHIFLRIIQTVGSISKKIAFQTPFTGKFPANILQLGPKHSKISNWTPQTQKSGILYR